MPASDGVRLRMASLVPVTAAQCHRTTPRAAVSFHSIPRRLPYSGQGRSGTVRYETEATRALTVSLDPSLIPVLLTLPPRSLSFFLLFCFVFCLFFSSFFSISLSLLPSPSWTSFLTRQSTSCIIINNTFKGAFSNPQHSSSYSKTVA